MLDSGDRKVIAFAQKIRNMKLNWIMCVLALLVSALFGLLCFEIAKDVDSRNWISLTVSGITTFICLASAIGLEMSDKRIVNIKVNAWVFTVLVALVNIIFCCFVYNIIFYIVVVGLLVLLNVGIVYALYPKQQS